MIRAYEDLVVGGNLLPANNATWGKNDKASAKNGVEAFFIINETPHSHRGIKVEVKRSTLDPGHSNLASLRFVHDTSVGSTTAAWDETNVELVVTAHQASPTIAVVKAAIDAISGTPFTTTTLTATDANGTISLDGGDFTGGIADEPVLVRISASNTFYYLVQKLDPATSDRGIPCVNPRERTVELPPGTQLYYKAAGNSAAAAAIEIWRDYPTFGDVL